MTVERHDYAEAVASYIERSRSRIGSDISAGRSRESLIRDLEEALEELSVSEEELRVQNDEIQAALRGNELERQRYQALFDSAPEAYIVSDANGVIREANRAAAVLFQVPPALLIGKPLAVYLPPDEKRTFRSRLLALGRLEHVHDWDLSIARRDGDVVPVSISAVGLTDATTDAPEIRWLLRDQTERRRAEEAKRQLQWEQAARLASEQAERRALFLANASRTFAAAKTADEILRITATLAVPFLGSFCLLDRLIDGRITRVAARHAEDAQREPFAQLAEQVPQDVEDDPIARVIRTGEAEVITRPDREVRRPRNPLEDLLDALDTHIVLVIPLRGQGEVLGAITIGRSAPITPDLNPLVIAKSFAERAALALEHALLVQELEASRREAQDANRAKADFLATLSHEIRTPLTAALGYTELLVDGVPDPLPERARAFARGIQASIHHQISIVDDLLLFARVEAGTEHVRCTQVDVRAIMEEVALLFGPEAAATNIALIVDAPEHAVMVNTDRSKLRQILLNLCANALRYTEDGEIRLRAAETDDTVRIEVMDTGIGIAPEDLEKVFDRFWRGESVYGRPGGMGLGLTITQHLTQLLGGTVSARSAPGEGSVFAVELPKNLPASS